MAEKKLPSALERFSAALYIARDLYESLYYFACAISFWQSREFTICSVQFALRDGNISFA